MLQKVLVILVGLFMSIVGAFAPSGSLFASHPAAGVTLSSTAQQDATLATVRTADGGAFAKVSVLWVEVDGRRVTDDAWGTGEVHELKFKVGTKAVDGLALAVGDKVIALHPTDVLTVRMFRGEFAYRGMSGPAATVALQGTVKTALVSPGVVTQRVQTQAGTVPAPQQAPADGRLAYVVLDTGEHLDTVAVQSTGGRFVTQGEDAQAPSTAGNLLARYVKIDGRLVKDYTAGDGALDTIEFQPAEAATRTGSVEFNGAPAKIDAQGKVIVRAFVGEYLVYQVSDGLVRLRLDGYAEDYATGEAARAASAQAVVGGIPNVAADFEPLAPRTSDVVTFHDRSVDDGYVVFRQWDFGDGQTSIAQDPTHRYALPGVYEVKLNVTDNDLHQRQITFPVTVRNSDPVADFDFAPKLVTSQTLVSFTDQSTDLDGTIASWTWDFGDGAHDSARHPTHKFGAAGTYAVTLTATDNLGGAKSLSKQVVVRNVPPLAQFAYAPDDAESLVPVQFLDHSADVDGHVVAWNWSFGDGTFGTGSAPTHAYAHPGSYSVSLTATDEDGGANTATQTVVIRNRAPEANFTWNPRGSTSDVPVTFTSTSTDPDGVILLTQWSFDDGSQSGMGTSIAHTFPRFGVYNVTMTVTDGLATTSLTRSVAIENAAPRASLQIAPNPAYRGQLVVFADTTTDRDGDAIVSRAWSFGDNATSTLASPNHTYNVVGDYPITLQVTDAQGLQGFASQTLHVINRAPIASARSSPLTPVAGENVTFEGSATDPDDVTLARGPLMYEWVFPDQRGSEFGQTITHKFRDAGTYQVTLFVHDAEGGVSAPAVARVVVDFPRPVVAFAYSPVVPLENQPVSFTDLSTTTDAGGLTTWSWEFGDGATSTERNPTHAYGPHRLYTVRLTVSDAHNSNSTTQALLVNARPIAAFEMSPASAINAGSLVTFTDASQDPEGEPLAYNWSFGDGSFSTQQSPTHAFSTPGDQTVLLNVTDPHGAWATTPKTVRVLDRAPTAGFTFSPAAPRAGQPVSFDGSASHDPDGDATLVSYAWSFGDGLSASGVAPTHTYGNSGVYRAQLIVNDGHVDSTPAIRTVRVGSDHSATVRLSANLPGNRQGDLADSHYHVVVTVQPSGAANAQLLGKGDLTYVAGGAYDLFFQTGAWLAGDQVTLSVLDDRWMGTTSATKTIMLTDADGRNGPVALRVDLAVPLVPSIVAAPGEQYLNVNGEPVPGFENATRTPQGDPIYRSPLERFHGNGTVLFADGAEAAGATVIVEARYLPNMMLASVRDTPVGNGPLVGDNLALGWCRATQTSADAHGRYAWVFDGADCLAGKGVFPLGKWEVRARAVLGFATVGLTQPARVIVDPTGGALAYDPGLPP